MIKYYTISFHQFRSIKEEVIIKRKLISLITLILIFSITLSPTSAVTTNSSDSLLDTLLNLSIQVNTDLNVTMTDEDIADLRNTLILQSKYQADIQNISQEDVYQHYICELQQHNLHVTQLSDSGSRKTPLPTALTGYIFFTDTPTFYNHCGIYKNSSTIVEALSSPGVWSKSIYDEDAYQTTVIDDNDSAVLSISGATSNTRSDAASWAASKVGRPYDFDFLDNKTDGMLVEGFWMDEDDSYNCSELVWKAYMKASNNSIDLDSNGGDGVYPNDIYESSLTSTWKTFG